MIAEIRNILDEQAGLPTAARNRTRKVYESAIIAIVNKYHCIPVVSKRIKATRPEVLAFITKNQGCTSKDIMTFFGLSRGAIGVHTTGLRKCGAINVLKSKGVTLNYYTEV